MAGPTEGARLSDEAHGDDAAKETRMQWTSPFASLLPFAREHRWRTIVINVGRHFVNDRELVEAVRGGRRIPIPRAKQIAAKAIRDWSASPQRKALADLFDSLHAVEKALRVARRKVDAAVETYGPPPSLEECRSGVAIGDEIKRRLESTDEAIKKPIDDLAENLRASAVPGGYLDFPVSDFHRYLAAEKIVKKERPDLVRAYEDDRYSAPGYPMALLKLKRATTVSGAILQATERDSTTVADSLDAILAQLRRLLESDGMVRD